MAKKWLNNFRTTLASSITNSGTTLTLASGTGSPLSAINLAGGDRIDLTLKEGTKIEIVQATAQPTSDTLTVTRAQDGTTAQAFGAGTVVECRITRGQLQSFLTTAGVTARKNSTGSTFGPRSRINFIEGTNVTLTVADDGANDEIDVTIAAAGGGGGGGGYTRTLYDGTAIAAASGIINHTIGENDLIHLRSDSGENVTFRLKLPSSPGTTVYHAIVVFDKQFGGETATMGFDLATPSSLTDNLYYNGPTSLAFPDSVGWTSGLVVYEVFVEVISGTLEGVAFRTTYS